MSGFWLIDEDGGETHIKGNPAMSDATLEAICGACEALYQEELELIEADVTEKPVGGDTGG